MKHLRLLTIVSITCTLFAFFVFFGTSSAAHASTCTPQWYVAQSAPIFDSYSTPGTRQLGTIKLLRDGCGDIQAVLDTTVSNSAAILQTPSGQTIGYGTKQSPVYSGYGGVSVRAQGVIIETHGDQGVASINQTANDAGY